jgi:porin
VATLGRDSKHFDIRWEWAMLTRYLWIVFALCGAFSPLATWADDAPSFNDTLTGDWGGWRTRLWNEGLNFSVGYVSETASNIQGGTRTGVRYTDQWSFGATLDLNKLFQIHDAQFQFTITDRNGRNLSSDEHLGSLQQVQEVFGRGQTWRITQLWYDQTYFNNFLDWKIGRLTVGEDSATFACDFMNLTFCGAQPGNLVGNYWFNWPVSQWGTRLKAQIPDLGYAQFAAYEVNPAYLTRANAFNPGDPSGATGVLMPVEVAWLPTFGDAKLAGSYKVGAWYNTSTTPDVFENTQGQPLAVAGGQPRGRNGAYGLYLSFVQKLTNPSPTDPDQGLSAFFNATFADRRTAAQDSQIAIGVKYTGPFSFRPKDDIALAFGRTHVNSRVALGEELENDAGLGPVPVQGSEYAAELYYTIQATDWLALRPNIQYIHQPGGISQTDDVILGLKMSINF